MTATKKPVKKAAPVAAKPEAKPVKAPVSKPVAKKAAAKPEPIAAPEVKSHKQLVNDAVLEIKADVTEVKRTRNVALKNLAALREFAATIAKAKQAPLLELITGLEATMAKINPPVLDADKQIKNILKLM